MAGSPWTNQVVNLIVLTEQATGFSGLFGYSPAVKDGDLILSAAAAAGLLLVLAAGLSWHFHWSRPEVTDADLSGLIALERWNGGNADDAEHGKCYDEQAKADRRQGRKRPAAKHSTLLWVTI